MRVGKPENSPDFSMLQKDCPKKWLLQLNEEKWRAHKVDCVHYNSFMVEYSILCGWCRHVEGEVDVTHSYITLLINMTGQGTSTITHTLTNHLMRHAKRSKRWLKGYCEAHLLLYVWRRWEIPGLYDKMLPHNHTGVYNSRFKLHVIYQYFLTCGSSNFNKFKV